MALASSTREVLDTQFHQGHRHTMQIIANNISAVNNYARHTAAKWQDEMSPESAKAVEKVLNEPSS